MNAQPIAIDSLECSRQCQLEPRQATCIPRGAETCLIAPSCRKNAVGPSICSDTVSVALAALNLEEYEEGKV